MSLKKLLLALPVLMTGFAIDATAATYDCNKIELPGQAVNNANEYLYISEADYKYDSSSSHYHGKAYVCGHKAGSFLGIGGSIGTNGCYTGAKIVVDGPHYLAGNRQTGRHNYECDRGGGNVWYDSANNYEWVPNCSNADNFKKGDKYNKFFEYDGDVYYCIYSRFKTSGISKACIAQWDHALCKMTLEQSACYDAGQKWVNGRCQCKDTTKEWKNGKCEKDINNLSDQQKCASIGGNWYNGICRCDDRDYFDPDVKQCLPKSQCNKSAVVCANNVINLSDFGNSTTTVNGGNASVSNSGNSSNTNNNENNNNSKNTNGNNAGDQKQRTSCRASRTTVEGVACCDLPLAEAKWANNKCTCTDSNKEFKIKDGKGVCEAKGTTQPGIPVACNCTVDLSVVSSAESSCAAQSMATAIKQVRVECEKGTNCNGQTVSVYVNAIAEAMSSCANQPVEPEKPQLNEQRLAAAVEAIDKYRSGLDVSVWKDAEGNFNTARLVSDSIAGVVLGTAGGLITSSVVKKNQVKNGFEDVVCTIGGQTVGSYGDEISVGIK